MMHSRSGAYFLAAKPYKRYMCIGPDYSKDYYERFKEYPDYMAAETYAGVYFIKSAVERAGTTDTEKIIQAVEKEPLAWETPEGWKIMLGADHSVIEDCLWGETKWGEEFGFAIPRTFVSIQGEEIVRTAEELVEVQKQYQNNAGQ